MYNLSLTVVQFHFMAVRIGHFVDLKDCQGESWPMPITQIPNVLH
jgi:NAD(P)H-flavin reductase